MYCAMEKNHIIGLIIIVLILIGGGTWYLQSVQQSSSAPIMDITIDPGHTAASTLLMVAKDQGYFAQHGLNVTFKESPSGSVAIQDLLNHKSDFIYIHDYTLSDPGLYNKNLQVIGTLSESDTNYVVGRKDRGIFHGQVFYPEWAFIGEYYYNLPPACITCQCSYRGRS